jgi:ribonuclease HI
MAVKLTKVSISEGGLKNKSKTMKMPYKYNDLWYDIWELSVPDEVFIAWRKETYDI